MKSHRHPKSNRRQDCMEQLEGRQLMAASSIKLVGNDLQNILASGSTVAKANANNLILTFSGKVKVVDKSKIRIFAYASDNTSDTGAQIKTTINITDASVDKTGTKVTLKTGILVRKGASISLNAGGIQDTSGNDVTTDKPAEAKKGVNKARFTLAGRAFKVQDKSLFGADVLTGGATPVSTGSSELNEANVKTALSNLLDKKVKQGTISSAQKTATLARFSASATTAVATSANLRAAILSLVGTVGEPAIEYYLGTANSTGKAPIALRFDNEFDNGATIIATSFNSSGRLRVILNPSYVGESFVVLSGILAKESFQDTKDDVAKTRSKISVEEETVSNFVESSVYGQQLLADSNYASKGTALTLRANYRLYLAMNSGTNQFPRVGISKAPLLSANAAPGFDTRTKYGSNFGSNSIQSFQQDITDEYTSRGVGTKAAWALQTTGRAILAKLTGDTFASGAKIGDATLIKQVDQDQDALGDNDVGKLAKTLKVRI